MCGLYCLVLLSTAFPRVNNKLEMYWWKVKNERNNELMSASAQQKKRRVIFTSNEVCNSLFLVRFLYNECFNLLCLIFDRFMKKIPRCSMLTKFCRCFPKCCFTRIHAIERKIVIPEKIGFESHITSRGYQRFGSTVSIEEFFLKK